MQESKLTFDEVNNTLKCDIVIDDNHPDDDVEITDENFEQYFFDVRKHEPKPGQVMAKFSAMADFVDGDMKKDIIYLLTRCTAGSKSAQRVLRKLAGAVEEDSYRVLREMMQDLLNGMTEEEVYNKPYHYHCEFFFYCDPDIVPFDDPHWSIIRLMKKKEPDKEEVKTESIE